MKIAYRCLFVIFICLFVCLLVCLGVGMFVWVIVCLFIFQTRELHKGI